MALRIWLAVGVCLGIMGCGTVRAGQPTRPSDTKPERPGPVGEIKPTERIRPECPIRLGGVFLLGLGETGRLADSAANGVKISDANRDWIAAHCDLAALSPNTLAPNTLSLIRARQRLFTPLLYLYASSIYEDPRHRGNVGGWEPRMRDWTLRDSAGAEVKNPEPGGHWMDFGSTRWAAAWKKRAETLCRAYGAFGAVAAETPQANSFVGDSLQKYHTEADRGAAAERWLRAAADPGKYLLLPSAVGFDLPTPHTTPTLPASIAEPGLSGRYWDQFNGLIDGAWAEGWVFPYWADEPLPDTAWETQIEAADRAARTDKVFIVSAAYRNDDELEYALASYLLVAKRQSRVVFQPMPLRPGEPTNAGTSLAVLKEEVAAKSAYFDAPLGVALQQRHAISLHGAPVWRRAYQFGDVYVNSDDHLSATVALGGPMLSVNGQIWQSFVLGPHRGAILRYPPEKTK